MNWRSAPHGVTVESFRLRFRMARERLSDEGGGFLLYLSGDRDVYVTDYEVDEDGRTVHLFTYSVCGDQWYPLPKPARIPRIRLREVRGF